MAQNDNVFCRCFPNILFQQELKETGYQTQYKDKATYLTDTKSFRNTNVHVTIKLPAKSISFK